VAKARAEQAPQGKDFDSAAGQPIDIACKGATGFTEPSWVLQQDCIRTEIDGCVGRIEA
jgi:hypothetical protein